MKRYIAISGILLLVAVIIISGSAVATWYYIVKVDSETNCTNASNALYSPDDNHATIGQNPSTIGTIILDLGTGTSMEGGEEFIVYASSVQRENYTIRLLSDATRTPSSPWTQRDDTTDVYLTAPTPPGDEAWRFFEITSEEGDTSDDGDTIFGSEIDAIGFDY
jgi:hypothetical protein